MFGFDALEKHFKMLKEKIEGKNVDKTGINLIGEKILYPYFKEHVMDF